MGATMATRRKQRYMESLKKKKVALKSGEAQDQVAPSAPLEADPALAQDPVAPQVVEESKAEKKARLAAEKKAKSQKG